MNLYKGNTMEVINKKVEAISKPFSSVIVETYEYRLSRENVDLIQLPNQRYVSKEDVRNKIDLLWLNFCAKQIDVIEQMLFHDERIMESTPCGIGKFVDENSLEEIPKKSIFKREK